MKRAACIEVQPVITRIASAIRVGDTRTALDLCSVLARERIMLHDFLAETATATASWILRELSEDDLGLAFEYVFEQSAVRQIYALIATEVDRGLEAALLARNCWIAHSCSGAGEHGARFQIVEDEEKITFVLDPCGSGGRLWRKGCYEPQGPFALTAREHDWSYNRSAFPAYCTHCSMLNELLPYKLLGYSTWPVDPPSEASDVCRWHIFKDRYAVPARYYERFGLVPPEREGGKTVARYFSEARLAEMSTPTPERIREALDTGDTKKALRICREMGGEFFFLHNLYANAIACSLEYIARVAGPEALDDIFNNVYRTCVERQIASPLRELPRRDALDFIVHNFLLAGTCGGAGMPRARVRVAEDPGGVTVSLDPCPSGGKLLRHHAYEQAGILRRTTERCEDLALKFGARAPLPRGILGRAVYPLCDYICETRKPRGLGLRHGLPYYCSMCTSLVEMSGCDWLEVAPPSDRRGRCTWHARLCSV